MLLVTSTSWVAGISVFIFGGGLLAVVYYLLDTPGRKIRRLAREQDEEDNPPQA
jgi:hypothetical protein